MRPTPQEFAYAAEELSILRFFPATTGAREAVMELLERMVATRDQLNWLVRTMIDEVGEWQGPRELRGVFCTRYRPADGIEAWCATGKFSAEAMENRAALESAGYRSLPAPDFQQLQEWFSDSDEERQR